MCDTFLQPRWAKGPTFQRAPFGFHRSFTYLPHVWAPRMPGQYNYPTSDPILERRDPKVFADGHSEFIELFIFCHKLVEYETL